VNVVKYGYLRKDDDGHDYVIPEELIKEFDVDYEKMGSYDIDDTERWDTLDTWNEKWWDYAEGGSVSDYKVVISGSPITHVWVVTGESESGDDYGPYAYQEEPSGDALKKLARSLDYVDDQEGPGDYGSFVYLSIQKVRIE
jgi:hypothetical protein